jgi:hypothetical protein
MIFPPFQLILFPLENNIPIVQPVSCTSQIIFVIDDFYSVTISACYSAAIVISATYAINNKSSSDVHKGVGKEINTII